MRFMHMADVRLGAVPEGRPDWGDTLAEELWENFENCIADVRREQVELLLIAGDLFGCQPKMDQLRRVNQLFGNINRTRVVLMAGDKDYLRPDSPYLKFQWNRNVACLFSKKCECVRFPEIGTEVYGLSYYRPEVTSAFYDGLHPVAGDAFHVLLGHGGDAEHIPYRKEAFARSGFDYVALGHSASCKELVPGRVIDCGALTPLRSSETGPHGYVLGSFENGKISTRFVPRARREYVTLPVTVDEHDTTDTLKACLEEAIEQRGWQHIYRVVITGSRGVQVHFDADKLCEYGMVLAVEDRTMPGFNLEQLRSTYAGTLIGRFIDSFDGSLNDTQERALRYGLEALLRAEEKR